MQLNEVLGVSLGGGASVTYHRCTKAQQLARWGVRRVGVRGGFKHTDTQKTETRQRLAGSHSTPPPSLTHSTPQSLTHFSIIPNVRSHNQTVGAGLAVCLAQM